MTMWNRSHSPLLIGVAVSSSRSFCSPPRRRDIAAYHVVSGFRKRVGFVEHDEPIGVLVVREHAPP